MRLQEGVLDGVLPSVLDPVTSQAVRKASSSYMRIRTSKAETSPSLARAASAASSDG
jgi:hypothetical protein